MAEGDKRTWVFWGKTPSVPKEEGPMDCSPSPAARAPKQIRARNGTHQNWDAGMRVEASLAQGWANMRLLVPGLGQVC